MAKKSKTVLKRKYIYDILVDVATESAALNQVYKAATASDTFENATKATVSALDYISTAIAAGDNLGNKGRTTLIGLIETAHTAYKSTQKAGLRSDSHAVIEHSLFRLVQRLREDNEKKAVRKG